MTKTACSPFAFQIKTIVKNGALWELLGEQYQNRISIPQQIYDVWHPKVGGWVDMKPHFGAMRGQVVGHEVVYHDDLLPFAGAGDFEGDTQYGSVPSILDDEGPFLKVRIPEGATHYQDMACSADGGLRFFKRVGEEPTQYYVWGMSIIPPGGPRWVDYDRKLLRGSPLIALPEKEIS